MAVERSQLIAFLKTTFPFQKLNDLMLNLIADNLHVVEVPEGTRLFRQGSPAEKDELHILLAGNVRLYRKRNNIEEDVVLLAPGEIFGYEMLGNNIPHPVSAMATTNLTLLRMKRSHISFLITKIPELTNYLRILLNSYFLRLKVRLSWCESKEIVHYIANKHQIFLWLRVLPPISILLLSLPLIYFWYQSVPPTRGISIIILLVDLLITAGWALWNYLDWSNDYAIITNQRVAYLEKVLLLYESRQESPLEAILSIAVKTSYWGRVFSYGDVVVRTYAGSITLARLAYPQQVASYLELHWGRSKTSRVKMEKSALEEKIRQRLGYSTAKAPSAKNPSSPIPATVKPGSIQKGFKVLAEMFDLRVVKAGEITYRMHWIILLRQIFLPSVLLLGVVTLMLLGLFSGLGNLPTAVILVLGFLLFLGIGFWWIYQFIDWRDDYYVITPDQILDVYRKPFGKEIRNSAPLKNIQSIQFERLGLIGLVLNFGTVTILIGDAKLTFDNVYNPSDVQRELYKRLAEQDYAQKRAKIDDEQKWVGDWLSAYHQVVRDEKRQDTDGVSR